MAKTQPWLVPALAAAFVLAVAPIAHANVDEGMAHFRSGEFAEAAAQFQTLVDQSPGYADGWFMLGVSFMKMDKLDDAENNLLKAIELNGDKFDYQHVLAKIYFDREQYSKTVGTLKTAEPLVTDKTRWSLYYLRGMSQAALEHWADAVGDLEKAKALKVTPALLDRLGLAYYEMGHYDKALPALEAALKESPSGQALLVRTTNALLNLGAETKKAAYYQEALRYAEKYDAAKPGTVDGTNLVGRSALGAKEYAKAEQAFKKVLSLKADHCYAMGNLGKTYAVQEKWAEAEQILTEATACAPRMAVAWESLGFTQQKQTKLELAIQSYEKAKSISPSPAIQQAIDTCNENIAIREHNEEMDRLKAKQETDQQIEDERIRLEEEKRETWRKKTESDD
jgi:tetratricopeptide (TPR) repeat protein